MRGNVLAFLLTFNLLSFGYSLPSLVDTTKCKKRNGNFPKPGSYCRSYYSCSDWIPEEFECLRDEHFFPEKGYCVSPEMYPCFEKPKSKECPLPNGQFLKPNTGCKKYYDCCNGEPTVKSCSGDLLFNNKRGICDWPELVTCLEEEPKSKECPLPNGKFLKPNTGCKEYYDCSNGEPTVRSCSRDLLFNNKRGTCEWPELVTCLEEDLDSKVCRRLNGKFSKPQTGCKVYYDCNNGVATEKRCPKDQLFDPKKESCEWPEVFTCVEEACQPNPCKYGGECTDDMGKAVCTCKEPYTGDTCEINVCDPNPCKNRGICFAKEGKAKCSCVDPYGGDRCEKDKCHPNPCLNNGTCSVEQRKLTCSCKDPFTGEKCEINKCLPNPCFNKGTCSVMQGKLICSCKDPFIGERCLYICLPNPCLNNGTCSATEGKRYCSCKDPFIGEKCEINKCLPNPCLNNGTCSVRQGKLTCSCKDPFIGEKCEKNKCLPNPCLNSGTCSVAQGKLTCSCKDFFIGEKCETDTRTRETTTNRPTATDTVFIFCPHSDGYFPHPTNRHKFIACVGGNPTVMDCPSNLVYDHERRSCEYEEI